MTRWLTILAALCAIVVVTPALAQTATVLAAGQIEATVAPVALYPDALLAPLLMAATYPDEIAEAGTWLGDAGNQELRGDALVAALEPRPWDPSVKALVPFPVILEMMAAHRDWMKELGAMVVAAPAGVTDAVQKLRRQAITAGTLKSSPRLTVRDGGGIVTIAPADPAVAYIPVYNPSLVFDAWPDPDHPPTFIAPPPGFDVGAADTETGIGFSVGYGVLAPLWGWARADWSNHAIAIDTAAYNRINRYGPHVAASIWHHEPHATGYFHITQAQITPPTPALNHDKAAGKTGTNAPAGMTASAKTGVTARTRTPGNDKAAAEKRPSARTGMTARTRTAGNGNAVARTRTNAKTETAAPARTAAKTRTDAGARIAVNITGKKSATRHARAGAAHKARTAHASDHRRKIRLAAGGAREHHRR